MSNTKKVEGIRARLSQSVDTDIISDLQKAENMTERVKEMYRKALAYESYKSEGLVVRITHNGEVIFGEK